jgi:hypothetical protein
MKTIQIPPQFCFDLEQCAEIVGCSVQTLRANAKREESSRYFLRTRTNTPGGKALVPYADLEDYVKRTFHQWHESA